MEKAWQEEGSQHVCVCDCRECNLDEKNMYELEARNESVKQKSLKAVNLNKSYYQE